MLLPFLRLPVRCRAKVRSGSLETKVGGESGRRPGLHHRLRPLDPSDNDRPFARIARATLYDLQPRACGWAKQLRV